MRRSRSIAALGALLGALALCAPAGADWSGDGPADLLALDGNEQLLLQRGNGAGGLAAGLEPIATGWGAYDALLAPGDFDGDARPDLIVRRTDGRLLLYRGSGAGGFLTGMGEPIGAGWGQFTALLSPGDWSGDGKPDVLARRADGALLMYRGNGAGGWVTGAAEPIGSGWEQFTAILPAGDFSGDGRPDLLARGATGALLLYRGDGAGGFAAAAQQVGSGWAAFTALAAGGDFSGDGRADVLATRADGALVLYRGNGAGGWVTGAAEPVAGGWGGLRGLTLAALWQPPPPAPVPPSAPLPDGRVRLDAGIRCTPPGGRLRVSLRVRPRPGRPAPRVVEVAFFVRGGERRVDRRPPYVVRLPVDRPAGTRGRVFARVTYRRAGSKKVRRKTVSRRFTMCR